MEHDISVFLHAEFARIRNGVVKVQPRYSLPGDWPSQSDFRALIELAVPLFIFASTVCWFVGDVEADPEERPSAILDSPLSLSQSKLNLTYEPVPPTTDKA